MIIGVSGYGKTGATTITRLIKECQDVQSFHYGAEFQLLQQPDGILDLFHYIVEDQRKISSNTAIKRFQRVLKSYKNRPAQKRTNGKLVEYGEKYINHIIQVSWKGFCSIESSDVRAGIDKSSLRRLNNIIKRIGKKINYDFVWPPNNVRYYSGISEDEFIKLTKDYLSSVFEASHFELDKPILLEQLFPEAHPNMGMVFFDNARSIVVERDPRDLYIVTNHLMPHVTRYMPNSGNVNDFITYYKGIHKKRIIDDNVKYVQYEDFIYQYDKSKEELLAWLQLKSIESRKLFIPEESINTTCLFTHYPGLKHDIDIIEKELPEYLFHFELYKDASSSLI